MAIGGYYDVANPADKALNTNGAIGGGTIPGVAQTSQNASQSIGIGAGDATFPSQYPKEYQDIFDAYQNNTYNLLVSKYQDAYYEGANLPDTPENMAQSQIIRGNGIQNNPVFQKMMSYVFKANKNQGVNPDPYGVYKPEGEASGNTSGNAASAPAA